MAKHVTKSLEETHALAAEFIARILETRFPYDFGNPVSKIATVFAMHGDLGSGKTAFVQGVAEALGISHAVTSPTFVIQKRYSLPTTHYPLHSLIHIDAYRFTEGKDMQALRFAETLADKGNIVFIEWPEIVADVLPAHAIPLKFKFIDENTREIDLPEF